MPNKISKYRGSDSSVTSQIREAGGDEQKEKLFNDNLGKIIECFIPEGINLEVLRKQLENINRIDVPVFLDPKTATWTDVAYHAHARQNLGITTIEKHFRTARFMVTHSQPIDFRNLTVESVIKHNDYRITFENASRDALRHERDAVYMFLRAFKQFTPEWKEYLILPKKTGKIKNPFVIFPSTLNRLYHANYSNDEYENALLQTVVFTLANIGMRPPSEVINLDTDSLVINDDGTGYIWIKEKKKGDISRQYIPFDKKVLSSKVYRTPLNYLKTWRPLVKNKNSGNAFFLQPNGKRITGKYLRDNIVSTGKQICKDNRFKLYTLRHTFATYYYDYTKNIAKVARVLGHSKTDSVDFYINIATDFNTQLGKKTNLFNQALRQLLNIVGGKPEKGDRRLKKALSRLTSPIDKYGPEEILTKLQKRKSEIVSSFRHYLGNINSLTKPFFFFFYGFSLLPARISNKARNRRHTHQGVVKYAYFTSFLAHEIVYPSSSRDECNVFRASFKRGWGRLPPALSRWGGRPEGSGRGS